MAVCKELCAEINKALKERNEEALINDLRLLHAYVRTRFVMKLPLDCGDFDSFIETVRKAAETLDYEDASSFIDGREW